MWRSATHAQGAEGQDLLAVEPARMGEVDGLESGRMAQLGGAQAPLELALLAGRPLGVDEQAEALLEAERSGLGGLDLLLAGVGHRAELVRSASVLLVGRGVVVGAADAMPISA